MGKDGMVRLSPHEAAKKFLEDPDSVIIKLPDFLQLFGVTSQELVMDLAAGLIHAVMPARYHGRDALKRALKNNAVGFEGGEVLRWMAARKAQRHDG